jgi:hypothetical protein
MRTKTLGGSWIMIDRRQNWAMLLRKFWSNISSPHFLLIINDTSTTVTSMFLSFVRFLSLSTLIHPMVFFLDYPTMLLAPLFWG